MRTLATVVLLGLLQATTVAAQTAPGTAPASPAMPSAATPRASVRQIVGTIVSNDGQNLTVKLAGAKATAAMAVVTVPFDDQTIIVRYERRRLADVHTGDFIALAALARPDGTFRAARINLFPADGQHRGVGEGRVDNVAGIEGRSSINGTVTGAKVKGNSGTLSLSYHGSEPSGAPACDGYAQDTDTSCSAQLQIAVLPGVPVTGIVESDSNALAAGTAVSITALTDRENRAYAITIQ